MSGVFANVNRGKRSIVLDLRSDNGKSALRALIETADVFIHSMRAKAIGKLGFAYDEVAAINPAIVYTNCYGYGRRGPDRDLPAYDDTIQAECGLPAVQQMLTGEASYVGTIMADKVAGLTALYATMMALFHRERTGEGQEVEVAMFETMASFMLVEHANGAIFEPRLDRPAIRARWPQPPPLPDQRRLHFGADLHRQALVGVHRRRAAAMGLRPVRHARAAGPPDRHGVRPGGPDDAGAHHRGMADAVSQAGDTRGANPHTRRAVRRPAPKCRRAVRDGG
ncbi:coA-transferase III family protein [Mycobacterium xenopi 3993]|nr:coA-transferase III family protein [Mycobacterium xenopi 3993]